MFILSFWLSIPLLQQISYLPAHSQSAVLRLQLTIMPQQILYRHNTRSISLSYCFLHSAFHVLSWQQASFWIASCAVLLRLGPCLPPDRTALHSLYAFDVWIGLSICPICLVRFVESSVSKRWLLYIVLTERMGAILDVARYGPDGGQLCLLCQGWYAWSTWTKQNLRLECCFIRISNANHTTLLEF